jgi:hypothetical protein
MKEKDTRLQDTRRKSGELGAENARGFGSGPVGWLQESGSRLHAVQGGLRSSIKRGRAGAGGTTGFGQDHRDVIVVRRFRAHELAGELAVENEG